MTAPPFVPLHTHTDATLAGPFFQPADDSLRVVGPMQLPSASALIPNFNNFNSFNNNELFAAVQGRNLNQSLGRDEGEGEKDDPPERRRQHGRAADNGLPPFYCLCGADFTRPDSLKRHIKAKTKGGAPGSKTFRCPLCERYDVQEFSRRDHLTQHLKSYHRLGKKGLDFFA